MEFDLLNSLRITYTGNNQVLEILNSIEGDLYQKLWHKLSDNIILLTEIPELQRSHNLIQVYNQIVLIVERNFNPMKLMLIISNVLKNYSGNYEEALIFLEAVERKTNPKGEEMLFLKSLKGMTLLSLGKLFDCEEIISSLKFTLSKMFDVDPLIYCNFYKLSADYFFRKQNHDEFYNTSLQYLSYAKELSQDEKLHLSYNMAIASLVGEKLFNFAELIEKDFFKSLVNSKFEWIYHLSLSFNASKVEQFLTMMDKYADYIKADETLRNKVDFLRVKIQIAALLDLIFQKNKNERVLTYKEICNVCLCDIKQVEILVMKALSAELIKGFIDEVESKVIINWVQPKFLDREKISFLHDRVDQWITKSNKILSDFQNATGGIV